MLKHKKIVVFVTGGIAVYKTVTLVRELIKQGAQVKIAMTENATKFVAPLTFQVLSQNRVFLDTFEEEDSQYVSHIHLADWAEYAIVSPATANIVAKIANGIADDFVTTTLSAIHCPVFIIPAMNSHMYENPASKNNRMKIRQFGYTLMEPDTGFLAEGYEGKGRYPELFRIMDELEQFILKYEINLPLKGKKIIITAGGTRERIDPVRFISNDSSGKMGHALAKVFRDKGAEVLLVTTSSLNVASGVKKVTVSSADEMFNEVDNRFATADVLIMAAAVSDYSPKYEQDKKIKKDNQSMQLELVKTIDILKTMGSKKEKQLLVGFAAETNNLKENAEKKLAEKNCDLIIANDVSKKDRGFNVDTNEVMLLTPKGEPIQLSLNKKEIIAEKIVDKIISMIQEKEDEVSGTNCKNNS